MIKKYPLLPVIVSVLVILALIPGCGGPGKQTELELINEKAIEYNSKGIEAVRDNDYDKALIYFERSLELNLRADNQRSIVINLLNMGRLYILTGKNEEAGKVILKAYNMAGRVNDYPIQSEIYGTLGKYYYSIKKYPEAVEILNKGIAIDRKYKIPTAASKFNVLAMTYISQGSLREAGGAIREAINDGQKYGLDADIADSIRLTGDIALAENSFERAEKMYKSALEIDKKNAVNKVSTDLCSLGRLYLKTNKPGKAVEMFLRGYEIDVSRDNEYYQLRDLGYLVEGYTALNDMEKVAFYQKEKIGLTAKIQNRKKQG